MFFKGILFDLVELIESCNTQNKLKWISFIEAIKFVPEFRDLFLSPRGQSHDIITEGLHICRF